MNDKIKQVNLEKLSEEQFISLQEQINKRIQQIQLETHDKLNKFLSIYGIIAKVDIQLDTLNKGE